MTDDYVRQQDEQERQRQEGSGDTLSTSQGATTVRLTPMDDAPPAGSIVRPRTACWQASPGASPST